MDLSIDDVKNLVFDVYMLQRENNQLKQEIAHLRTQPNESVGVATFEGVSSDAGSRT